MDAACQISTQWEKKNDACLVFGRFLQFSDRVNVKRWQFGVETPVALRNGRGNAVMQMGGFACRVAGVAHFADGGFPRHYGAEMRVDFAEVGVVVEAEARTEHKDAIAA